ncbi:MAG TPA: 3-hydroxyacyl-CoA dehydrogenase NAD-binding domain-containing protein, partial [Egibacteraceae bacterium]|nr:3-hydroxyacyl-CoA dehydrogenase NAD-binding domain-containing protein [Egibacteraceae bacterium]
MQLRTMAFERDAGGIVTLTLDDRERRVNTMRTEFLDDFESVLDALRRDAEGLRGVIVTSAKSTFFAGGNVDELFAAGRDDAAAIAESSRRAKAVLRQLETLDVPVAAALNGSALGGGLEIALACHFRVALDNSTLRLGFPEVTLGLLPGAGGVVRSVRLLGLAAALDLMLSGRQLNARAALAAGLVQDLAANTAAMLDRCRRWIAEGRVEDARLDEAGYADPWLAPFGPASMAETMMLPSRLVKSINGRPDTARRSILCAALESVQVDLDSAFLIETRYFTELVCASQQAKNLIQSGFYDTRAIKAGLNRPADVPQWRATKVGVVGAGMMGAGIAYVCAAAGLPVVLKDVSAEKAAQGRDYSARFAAKQVQRGELSAEQAAGLVERIRATASYDDLRGCDVVIEAVFESAELKRKVFAEVEAVVGPEALLSSNTSSLPVTELAGGVSRPADFLGLHFFSPVPRMALLEIVRGAETSDEALARAIDFSMQIAKTPIIVNDSRGFFTSRVIATFLYEAVAAVGEGVPAALVERAGLMAGYPAAPLSLLDDLTLTLPLQIADEARAAREAAGRPYEEHPGLGVLRRMVALPRHGRAAGAGFYDYAEDGSRLGLWSGLAQ